FGRHFVRCGKKSRPRGICGNRFDGKRLQRRLAPTAKLGEKLGETACAFGLANVKGRPGDHGMAQKKGSQLVTRVASDTNDGDVPGISHFTCTSIFFWRDSRALRLGVMMRRNSCKSRERVACVTRSFCWARRRRRSS